MASIESSFDPRAGEKSKNPHKGLYQFGPDEWKQWGGGKDIFDPEANIDAFIGYHGTLFINGLSVGIGAPQVYALGP